jgi:hypothetical protein
MGFHQIKFFQEGERLFYFVLFLSLSIFTLVLLRFGWLFALIFSLLPFLVYLIIHFSEKPLYAFLGLFVVNYFVMGLTRYVTGLPGGILIDALLFVTLFLVILFGSSSQSRNDNRSLVSRCAFFGSL